MDKENISEVKKVSFFQKIINGFFVFFWIIFFVWWFWTMGNWDLIYWISLLVVWLLFFPSTYEKIKLFLSKKKSLSMIVKNYWKLYILFTFTILILWVSLSNNDEITIKRESSLIISYWINEEVTNKETLSITINQKYIDKITVNKKPITFDKQKEIIVYQVPLMVWENSIIIRGENKYYNHESTKNIKRLTEDEYQLYLQKLEQEKNQREKVVQELKTKELAEQKQRELEQIAKQKELEIAKNWIYTESKDDMTDDINKYATAIAENELYFDFPYQGWSESALIIRKKQWELNIILQVKPSQILWDYNYPTIRARFDNNKPVIFSYTEPADNSSDSIFIGSEYKFLESLKKSKKLLLEVWFYQNWTRTIEFNTEWLKW